MLTYGRDVGKQRFKYVLVPFSLSSAFESVQVSDQSVRHAARRHRQPSERDASLGGGRRRVHVHGRQPSGNVVALRQAEHLR